MGYRRSVSSVVVAALVSSVVGCADDTFDGAYGADVDAPDRVSAATDAAIVALTVNGQQFCTGTLIEPDVVLTAAHCLPPHVPLERFEDIEVFFGDDVEGDGAFVGVRHGWTHPDWSEDGFRFDIGLLRLVQPATVAPIPLREVPMGHEMVGAPVRISGFGISESGADDGGTKREATTEVTAVYQGVFEMGVATANTCQGDSGGPALIVDEGVEQVAGVHSRSDCETSSIDTSVADHRLEIEAFLRVGCDRDGYCADDCAEPDPDCRS
ncbi:MAG: trypsin-like serine protease [Myxococcota bacterium]